MHHIWVRILVFIFVGTACAWAGERQAETPPAPPTPDDMKIIAVMEILQLLDVTEEMEMIKELEYLIEDDQDER